MGIAIVTGASGAIGSAIVRELEKEGGVKVLGISSKQCDLSNLNETQSFLDCLDVTDVEVLVFCAGVNKPNSLIDTSIQTFQETLNTNTFAHKLVLDKFIPYMADAKYGRIIGISSLYSVRSRSGRSAYSASKAALESLIRSVAVEYGKYGILANCVAPGFIDTQLTRRNNTAEEISSLSDRIPLKRLGNCEEVARTVSFLASRENTYITGQTIYVDGGIGIV